MKNQSEDSFEELLYFLVHEITNPVTINQLVIGRIKKRNPDLETVKDLDTLARANSNLIDLLSQVRLFLAVRSGKLPTRARLESVAKVIKEVLQLQQVLADGKNIALKFVCPDENLVAHIEPALIKSIVLSNLLTNAIKFSPPNSTIEIRLNNLDDNTFKIEVQDYGVGIPQDLRPHLFHFNQPTNRDGTNGEKGTGFGLPIVKKFVEIMNGSIEVFSQEQLETQTGSLFVVKLPLNPINTTGL